MTDSKQPAASRDGDRTMGRRDFLAHAAGIGAALTAAAHHAGAAEPKPETRNASADLVYRRLGRTNFAVSTLAFGGVVLSADRLPVFEAAVERGVNFIMAHGGACTEALAPWLRKPANRDRIFLGYAGGPRAVDGALKDLGTEVLDLLMVPLHTEKAAADEDVPRAFDALRQAGKARHLCLVFHSNVPAVWKKGLEVGWFDAFLPTYNWPAREMLKPLIADTKRKNIGLLTMKSLNGLPKDRDVVATWKTFLDDGIDAILKGITEPGQLDAWLRVAKRGDATAAAGPIACPDQCALCGTCAACPQGIAIQDILRAWQYYGRQLGWTDVARAAYAGIPETARPAACADCGRCERVCTQGLPVRRLLRQAHRDLA